MNNSRQDWIMIGSQDQDKLGASLNEQHKYIEELYNEEENLPLYYPYCYVKNEWVTTRCRIMQNGDYVLPYSMSFQIKRLQDHNALGGHVNLKMLIILEIKLKEIPEEDLENVF